MAAAVTQGPSNSYQQIPSMKTPIESLKNITNYLKESNIVKLFNIAEKEGLISNENHLPWKPSFHGGTG